uniref:Uncharacterized protein n=1 Tax=Arundo donax TaxID=35708 RepID=A0A0A9EK94_ARUDO
MLADQMVCCVYRTNSPFCLLTCSNCAQIAPWKHCFGPTLSELLSFNCLWC